jgi:septum formation protein
VPLVLASASPRRAELLRAAGFEFEVRAANVDERIKPGEPPAEYVRRLASEKSRAALALLAGRPSADRDDGSDLIVLGADTAVVIDGDVLGKPRDDHDAAGMLRRLSGRAHQVMTGVSVRTSFKELCHVECTTVEFARLSDESVAWYVESREGVDKAGAYAIQGLGSRFIPRIEGSYSNVVGLPITSVCGLLRELGTGTILSVRPFRVRPYAP